ncbi:M23 family metallopeptidase [Pseudoalteromonas tunicata]|uniref:M23/M37 peptidase domain protein n=1 Tax=Pseudoalteromonas tunicata D2 TaxID=87626 RepID=A4C8D5_9GAMM|nr:M23 family metallopeptidase [Pseudoalteromonas tunicata]ATC93355.1 hypothetical protein PTUN_a0581 [Pseudoalteromonas tunicata]EAR28850.1 M23/M37 peptidase domain protein [Pseudoalteromonas tunicata D2]MDP4983315.1 M23 family metallopeptidase [Pseudoalteromonas tunicata]
MSLIEVKKATVRPFNPIAWGCGFVCVLLSVSVVLNVYQWQAQTKEREHVAVSLQKVKAEYQQHNTDVVNLRAKTQDHLLAYQMKLAQLQGEVNRLAALGEKLAEVASIPENEYDMLQSVAQGGPATEDIASSQWVALDVFKEIDQIDLALASQAHKMSLLESVLMNHHIEESSQISGKPVTQGWLSSYFGVRKDPFSGEPAMHKGLDFAGIEGDAVITTGAGVVTWASERSGYGNLVEIDHGQGVATRYGHNRTILVKVGDVVEKGQAIAELGNTGRSTGAHVHYELLNNGEATNPLRTVYRTSAN